MIKSAFILNQLLLISILNSQVQFTDITELSGVQSYVQGRGVCVFDFNNDGQDDFFVCNHQGDDLLYQNSGGMTFSNIAESAGVSSSGQSQVAVAADYDADGDLDLFVGVTNNLSKLYRNNGNSTFLEVSLEVGIIYTGNILGAAWGDYNNDGWVDLYIANFGGRNYLFQNNEGIFTDVTFEVGAQGPMNDFCMQAIFIDFDNDGDQEILGTQDGYRGNYLLSMQMYGMYANIAGQANILAYEILQGMGVMAGDYNRDGWFDLYFTNLHENILFRNDGDGTFTNVSEESNSQDQQNSMAWGSVFIDSDNDGWLDIFSNNESGFGNVPTSYFHNLGDGTFEDLTQESGLYLFNSGYGSAISDLDNDGDSDLLVIGYDTESGVILFRNDSNGGNWIQINLDSAGNNRDQIGTVIDVWAQGIIQRKVIHAGSGFCSQNSFTQNFGLGESQLVDSLIIHWMDGMTTYYPFEINHVFEISEGELCIPYGEVTNDHALDILDIVAMVSNIMGYLEFTPLQDCQADQNVDGAIDVSDVILLVEWII
ncbi:MAG: FG-GAP-like repeat-containing protein [Fidelibacterota bacterium]